MDACFIHNICPFVLKVTWKKYWSLFHSCLPAQVGVSVTHWVHSAISLLLLDAPQQKSHSWMTLMLSWILIHQPKLGALVMSLSYTVLLMAVMSDNSAINKLVVWCRAGGLSGVVFQRLLCALWRPECVGLPQLLDSWWNRTFLVAMGQFRWLSCMIYRFMRLR